jgi:four helix bundle protein
LVTISISHISPPLSIPHDEKPHETRRFVATARTFHHGWTDNQTMSDALPAFDYQRLDAFKVARETLRLGDALARRLPRGYATLQDQLRRALLSAYLGIAEASSRQGADRLCRFRCARGEACEAAAALEGVLILNLAPEAEILTLLNLLDRLCAMLTRLAHMGDRPSGSAQIGQRERSR